MGYKWVKKLLNRITKADAPLNDEFLYYGHLVLQTSGQYDYTSVTIYEDKDCHHELAAFGFDFMTCELHFESYADDDIRGVIVNTLLDFYRIITISDDTIEERKREYQEYIDHPEIYVDEAVEEAKREMVKIESLLVGTVKKLKLN